MRVQLTAPVRHDGKDLPVDVQLDLDAMDGERLVRLGVAVRIIQGQEEFAQALDEAGIDLDSSEDESGSVDEDTDDDEGERPIERMSKDELHAELNALGVPFNARMNKPELEALLREARG